MVSKLSLIVAAAILLHVLLVVLKRIYIRVSVTFDYENILSLIPQEVEPKIEFQIIFNNS